MAFRCFSPPRLSGIGFGFEFLLKTKDRIGFVSQNCFGFVSGDALLARLGRIFGFQGSRAEGTGCRATLYPV